MPYTTNHGVRIHYQVEGEGPPLVLQHGFTDSLETWYELGYVETLQHEYRLILVDARGHGHSDKPHTPAAYDMALRAGDVVTVLDAVHVPQAHFMGYSMGGRIGFALATYAPARFLSFIIGGSSPYQIPHTPADPMLHMLQKGPEAIVWEAPLPPGLKARLLTNDIEALIASWTQVRESRGGEAVLTTMTMPCFLYAGEADASYARVKECVKHMPNVTACFLPGLNHTETFFRSNLVLPHVTRFLHAVREKV
jgi:pimeloyl-ACP methyl ester carboxylesterase